MENVNENNTALSTETKKEDKPKRDYSQMGFGLVFLLVICAICISAVLSVLICTLGLVTPVIALFLLSRQWTKKRPVIVEKKKEIKKDQLAEDIKRFREANEKVA